MAALAIACRSRA